MSQQACCLTVQTQALQLASIAPLCTRETADCNAPSQETQQLLYLILHGEDTVTCFITKR